MDTPPRPSLRDWIIARHAAGLPIASARPPELRPAVNVRALDDAGNGGKPSSRCSTDRLSIAAGHDAPARGDRPSRSTAPTREARCPPDLHRHRSPLNIGAVDTAESPGNPPRANSTGRLSIADGFALLDDDGVASHLDACFAALADPTRRAMVEALTRGEATVGALAAPHAMSLAAAARHVAVLDRAGLLLRRRIGRRHLCQLRPHALTPLRAWLHRIAGLPQATHPLNPVARHGSDDA